MLFDCMMQSCQEVGGQLMLSNAADVGASGAMQLTGSTVSRASACCSQKPVVSAEQGGNRQA